MAFGVTAAVVSQWANGLVFLDAAVGPPAVAASTPSLSACTEEITQAGRRVNAFLRSRGIAPESVTEAGTPDTYAICRHLVLLEVAAWALRSRGRLDPEQARAYAAERRDYLAMLRDSAALGSARATGAGASKIARGPEPTADPVPSSLLNRMITSGQA